MNSIDKLIKEIKQVLKAEVPSEYKELIDKFTELTDKDLLRASYDVLDQLRRKNDYQPSIKLQGLIDKYKVVF